jgi:hypothetical protein
MTALLLAARAAADDDLGTIAFVILLLGGLGALGLAVYLAAVRNQLPAAIVVAIIAVVALVLAL